jgi:uncharacterized protein (DUF433 family)
MCDVLKFLAPACLRGEEREETATIGNEKTCGIISNVAAYSSWVEVLHSRRSRRQVMDEKQLLARITTNPEIFSGKPIVRGMRISVELILSLLAQGQTSEDILADYPDLTREDIRACIAYAHAVIADDVLDAVQVAVK